MKKEKFIIIDGTNLFFRAFYALPLLTNKDGIPYNAVYGFTNMLVKIIQDHKPDYIAIAFDGDKGNFRREIYTEYKAQRGATPKEIKLQFPLVYTLLDQMGIKYLIDDKLEADDLIGCLSKQYDTENIIISADKDCLQLITDTTTLLQPKKGITESFLFDKQSLYEKYKLTPPQIVDLKSLMGDPSDNIPGVKGVGEKTALSLLEKYSTLENVYENIENITGKLKEKLIEDKDTAFLSKQLATIVTDVKQPYELIDFSYSFPFSQKVLEFFKTYQFNSLIKKDELFAKQDIFDIDTQEQTTKKQIVHKQLKSQNDIANLLKTIQNDKQSSFYLTDTSIHLYFDGIQYDLEFSINLIDESNNDEYISMQNAITYFKDYFESNSPKIIFDTKQLMHILDNFDITLNGVNFDIVVAQYLVYTTGKSSLEYESIINNNLLELQDYAYNLYYLKDELQNQLQKNDLTYLYDQIEFPLIFVLYDMEKQGFKLDRQALYQTQQKFQQDLDELTAKIYDCAGKEFNINSPKQLSQLLFDELKLSSYNNKKKSTGAQILEEMRGQHLIIDLILQYRSLSKLYSTYILAYIDLIDSKNDKIYTLLNQTLTSTGRLSSSEPNLQNIPVRKEEGKNIRKLFIPTTTNGYLISADYSQIELRLLACFSKDQTMISAFNNNIDIHTQTASQIFDIPIDQVTENQRRNAKAINFGIVYGISDYGLSQQIGAPVGKAANYIKDYFEKYPSIKQYMDQNIEYCRQNGFVKTHFGRIRHLPDINNSNYVMRQFSERCAMNMPLQGTASDIIKLAMLKVHQSLIANNLKSKLILQVHDELIIDCVHEEKDQVVQILTDCMTNIVDFDVKLEIGVGIGTNWYEAK